MSAADDRAILNEFAIWSGNFDATAPTVEAFLKERKGEHNGRRVDEALSMLNRILGRDEDEVSYQDLSDAIKDVHCILEDDRPFVESRNLTDIHSTRVYT